MDEWLDHMARSIGEEPITDNETDGALRLARDVAHGVERKLAPLACYLAGVQAGRRAAEGVDRGTAFDEVLALIRAFSASWPGPRAG